MIAMLCQLTQSNQSLLERVEKIEQQAANPHHTTVVGVYLPDFNPWAPTVRTTESFSSPYFTAFTQLVHSDSVKYFVNI